jgi:transcriptional accessory protein Tex/SPT6
VLNTLQNESLYHDCRKDTNLQPDFKRGIQKLSDLKVGQTVTGVVSNCVDFGAFVDIGVQQDGLIHKSKSKVPLKLGNRVSCKIINLDKSAKRISLELVNVL